MNIVKAETSFETVSFSKCVDGDTAYFMVNGIEKKFRFLAIDTPETVHPTVDVELYGKDASEFTCNKLTNAKEIIVEYEKSNKTDKYGRTLAWVWVDGSLIQKDLILIGYGEVAYIYGNYRYTEALCLNQSYAKEQKLGIWSDDIVEGYCSTIDISKTEDNIIYDEINVLTESEKKLEKTLITLEKGESKISDFLNNNDLVSKILLYGTLILAVIVAGYKEFKK